MFSFSLHTLSALLLPTGMGEKEVGVYQAVVMASWLIGALGKRKVRCWRREAEWNWWAMSGGVREEIERGGRVAYVPKHRLRRCSRAGK